MRVGVDETRADDSSFCIDLAASAVDLAADLDDDTSLDCYVGLMSWTTRSVKDHAISDYQVMHLLAVPSFDLVIRDRLSETAAGGGCTFQPMNSS
jgi:hypothetical protein